MIRNIALAFLIAGVAGCTIHPSRDRTIWQYGYPVHQVSVGEVWQQCGMFTTGCVQTWTLLPRAGDPGGKPMPFYVTYVSNSWTAQRHECGHLRRLAQGGSVEAEEARDAGIMGLKLAAYNPWFPFIGLGWTAADMLIPAGGEC
jgi:hypothetical protein